MIANAARGRKTETTRQPGGDTWVQSRSKNRMNESDEKEIHPLMENYTHATRKKRRTNYDPKVRKIVGEDKQGLDFKGVTPIDFHDQKIWAKKEKKKR